MTTRRHLAASTAGLLAALALPAWARDGDDGEFIILRARYGTDERSVDVTDRLRELARQDRRFRLTNDQFGVDPDPGRTKTLRLFVRDRQGRERRFDFREGDKVDGAQFVGWAGGRWGGEPDAAWQDGRGPSDPRREDRRDDGEFLILHATYGTARREVDVTDRLRELARRDQRLRMGNDSFGVDPDPGQTKVLRIVARDRAGQQRSFEYREDAWVDGAQFAGWGRGDWGRDAGPVRGGTLFIDRASYGTDERAVDVTRVVRDLARDNRLDAQVGNDLFGYDPAPGRDKTLTVTYRVGNGPTLTMRVREDRRLRLP